MVINENDTFTKKELDAAILAAVEKAVSEELAKFKVAEDRLTENSTELAASVKTARDLLATKDTEIESLKSAIGEQKTLIETIEQTKDKKGNIDVSKLIDEVTTKVSGKYEKNHGDQMTILRTDLEAANKRLESMELEKSRQEIIAAAEGEIVESLVAGATLEELTTSAENAKAEYQKIVTKLGGKKIVVETPDPVPSSNPGDPKGHFKGDAELAKEVSRVQKMSQIEYSQMPEAERRALRSKVSTLYQPE